MTLEDILFALAERLGLDELPEPVQILIRKEYGTWLGAIGREPRTLDEFLAENQTLAKRAFYENLVDQGIVSAQSSEPYLDLTDSIFADFWKSYNDARGRFGDERTFEQFMRPLLATQEVGEAGQFYREGGIPPEARVRQAVLERYRQVTGLAPSQKVLEGLIRSGTEGLEDVAFEEAFARVAPELRGEVNRIFRQFGPREDITDEEMIALARTVKTAFLNALTTGQPVPPVAEFIRQQLPAAAWPAASRQVDEAAAAGPTPTPTPSGEVETQPTQAAFRGGPPMPQPVQDVELQRLEKEAEEADRQATQVGVDEEDAVRWANQASQLRAQAALGRLGSQTRGAGFQRYVPTREEFAGAFIEEQPNLGFQDFLRKSLGKPVAESTMQEEFGQAMPRLRERTGQRIPTFLDFLRERMPLFQEQFQAQVQGEAKQVRMVEQQELETERAKERRRQIRGRQPFTTVTVPPR